MHFDHFLHEYVVARAKISNGGSEDRATAALRTLIAHINAWCRRSAVEYWVRMDERRPDHGQTVAFVVESNSPNTPSFNHLHRRVFGGRYDAENNWFSVPGLSLQASYWMPLAAAPIADNGGAK